MRLLQPVTQPSRWLAALAVCSAFTQGCGGAVAEAPGIADSDGGKTLPTDSSSEATRDVAGETGSANIDSATEVAQDHGSDALESSVAHLDATDAGVQPTGSDSGRDAASDALAETNIGDGAKPTGVVVYGPSTLSFGNVACGKTGTPQPIVFSNPGNQSYTVTATLGQGAASPYVIDLAPPDGVVAPQSLLTLNVTPKPIPAISAVPGNYDEILTVTTTVAGDTAHAITLTESAYGAILSLSTRSVPFPNTPTGATSIFQLAASNSGNAPATVVFTSVNNPVFAFDQDLIAPAGDFVNPNVYFTPTGPQTFNGTAMLGVAPETPLCQPLPTGSITLSGRGTKASTAVVTPASIPLGRVDCGTAAPTKTISIQNIGSSAFDWTATLQSGANFTLSANSGTVGPTSSAQITLTPAAIPVDNATSTGANAFGDVLTITTTAVNDNPHAIQISQTAQGAKLSFAPGAITVNHTNNTTANFRVINAGNIPAAVTLTNSNAASFNVNPLSGSSAAGAPFRATVTDVASAAASTTINMATSTVTCSPLPAALPITGR
jgi:hypothetical protein